MAVISPGFQTMPGSDRRAEPVTVVPYDPAWAGAFRRDDRMGYTEAKNDLIPNLVDQAERWAAAQGWTA